MSAIFYNSDDEIDPMWIQADFEENHVNGLLELELMEYNSLSTLVDKELISIQTNSLPQDVLDNRAVKTERGLSLADTTDDQISNLCTGGTCGHSGSWERDRVTVLDCFNDDDINMMEFPSAENGSNETINNNFTIDFTITDFKDVSSYSEDLIFDQSPECEAESDSVKSVTSSGSQKGDGAIFSASHSCVSCSNDGANQSVLPENSLASSSKDQIIMSGQVNSFLPEAESWHERKTFESEVWPQLKLKKSKETEQGSISVNAEIEKSNSTVSEHLLNEEPDGNHRPQKVYCKICFKWFKTSKIMECHVCKNNTKHLNQMRGKGFGKQVLNRHLKAHRNICNFYCNICEKTFNTLGCLKHHLYRQRLPGSYPCLVCNHSFKLPSELHHHILFHNSKKESAFADVNLDKAERYIYFDKRCSRESTLLKREEEEKFKAQDWASDTVFCTPTTNEKLDVNSLTSKCITKGNSLSYTCRLCREVFYTKMAYQKHKDCHESTASDLQCSSCYEIFDSGSDFFHHVVSQGRPFKCGICGAGFKRRDYAKKHLHTHSDNCFFHCKHCILKFKSRQNLIRHMEKIHKDIVDIHAKPSPFSCHKTFLSSYHVESHMKIHNKVRTHRSQSGDRGFHEEHHPQRHMLVHDQNVTED